jgi:hypothetical protein
MRGVFAFYIQNHVVEKYFARTQRRNAANVPDACSRVCKRKKSKPEQPTKQKRRRLGGFSGATGRGLGWLQLPPLRVVSFGGVSLRVVRSGGVTLPVPLKIALLYSRGRPLRALAMAVSYQHAL